jgi:hypothetical protein
VKRNRWILAALLLSLGLLAALVARAETPPAAPPRAYVRADRPVDLEPGMPCYEAAAAGYVRCVAESQAWATTAAERAFVARSTPVACRAYAGIWYDHCRWGGACLHGIKAETTSADPR